MLANQRDHVALPLVADWAERGWPLVVRRPVCADLPGSLPVGLPLPPALGKLRLAFLVPQGAVVEHRAPPLLADAAPVAPAPWRATIAALLRHDPRTRCYGSLAWQHLTGLDYLTPSSDLDLLWTVPDRQAADALVTTLAAIDSAAPMRIDGEMVAAQGQAVQWREWASGAGEVLVKSAEGAGLMARDRVFA